MSCATAYSSSLAKAGADISSLPQTAVPLTPLLTMSSLATVGAKCFKIFGEPFS